jgi:hypothetical protein
MKPIKLTAIIFASVVIILATAEYNKADVR